MKSIAGFLLTRTFEVSLILGDSDGFVHVYVCIRMYMHISALEHHHSNPGAWLGGSPTYGVNPTCNPGSPKVRDDEAGPIKGISDALKRECKPATCTCTCVEI